MSIHADRALALAFGAFLAGCGDGEDAPVAVTLSTRDGPAAGAVVVVHDSAGDPTSWITTNAAGRAAAVVPGGGMITALLQDGDDRYRVTFLGVEAGDELTFTSPRWTSVAAGTAFVTIAPYAGAAVYVIEDACSSVYTANVSQPIAIEVRTSCQSADGTFHLLVTALDDVGEPLAASRLRDLTWTDPMNITMPDWSPMAGLAVTASNAPPATVGVLLQVGYDANGVLFPGPSEGALVEPGQGATLSVAYAPGFGDRLQTQLGVMFGTSVEDLAGASMMITRAAEPPAARTVDLTADFLPRLSPPTLDIAEPGRPAATWIAARELSGADGGAITFEWEEAASREEWVILVPPDVTLPVRVPALPNGLAGWAPPAAATFDDGRILFIDADWVAGWDALRAELGVAFAFRGEQVMPAADATMRVTMSGDL